MFCQFYGIYWFQQYIFNSIKVAFLCSFFLQTFLIIHRYLLWRPPYALCFMQKHKLHKNLAAGWFKEDGMPLFETEPSSCENSNMNSPAAHNLITPTWLHLLRPCSQLIHIFIITSCFVSYSEWKFNNDFIPMEKKSK